MSRTTPPDAAPSRSSTDACPPTPRSWPAATPPCTPAQSPTADPRSTSLPARAATSHSRSSCNNRLSSPRLPGVGGLSPRIERMIDTLPDLDQRPCWPRRAGRCGSVGWPRSGTSRCWRSGRRCTRRTRPRGRRVGTRDASATCWSTPAARALPACRTSASGRSRLARGTGVTATSNAVADVLDLQHRLPRDLGGAARRARPRCSSPAGWPGCRDTCPPTGWASSTPPWRGSSPTRPADGCSRWPRPRSSRRIPSSTTSASRPSGPGATSAWAAPTSSACAR